MPNVLAYLMLLIWPVVMITLFRKLPVERALIWSLLGAYLILPPEPANFDFPLVPPLNKDSIPNLMAFAICLAMFGAKTFELPKSKLSRILIAMFVLGPVATIFTNPEPIFFSGATALPGLRITDAIALSITQMALLFSFLLARQFLGTAAAQKDLLVALVIGGTFYSVPMLLEVRLSPQLNLWVYGYFQHSFEQTIRFGGYRPVVFMNHGLWVAFFAMTAFIAAIALWRIEKTDERGKLYLLVSGYLGAALILCKSLGALVFAAFLLPLVLFTGRRFQINVALVLVLLALAYPILKGADLVPTEALLSQAGKVGEDRAASLQYRFYNEDLLLERAGEKPLFGWGSWGRNQIHDNISGTVLTVPDGRWIIVLGVFGWIGFIAEFGLLGLPVILLWRMIRLMPVGTVSPSLGPLALILAINIIDLLPNATLTPITWIISGALLGYAENLKENVSKNVMKRPLWRPLM